MHIWYLDNWKKYIDLNESNHKNGILLRFDAEVDSEVRVFCKKFAKWLRREFFFPIRVPIYVKADYRIKAKDGELVVGTFFWPADYKTKPYVRIATGDYQELKEKRGEEQAMWAILISIAHELTHYFQYVNNISLTRIGEERQATTYSFYILSDFADYLKSGESVKKKKDIWRSYEWERYIDKKEHSTGLRLKFDQDVNIELRDICKSFAKWLRTEYYFPTGILIYVKSKFWMKPVNGEFILGKFCQPDNYDEVSYVYIAVENYENMKQKFGKEYISKLFLKAIAYEVTCYYQWVNHVSLTTLGKKRQATRYAKNIVEMYLGNDS